MKQKILFCLQTMVCGGVEKELSTILRRLKNKYDITVLIFYSQDDTMLKAIPHGVKIVNLDVDKQYYCSELPVLIKHRIHNRHFVEALELILLKIFNVGSTPANLDLRGFPMHDEHYDYAVCYHMHSPIVLRYVADNINADKKLAWIHNDFKTTNFKVKSLVRWLDKYDIFVSVSKRLHDEFVHLCPQYAEKASVAHNVVDVEEINLNSDMLSDVDVSFLADKRFKIVTVGRFVEQKGFDLAISALKLIREAGYDASWYAIGYGKDEKLMKKLVADNNLQDSFIILGRKSNPYPYMRFCDLYVQPSRHEGYAITIEEVKALKRYIVCTNFAGAEEQIVPKVNGDIVPDFTPQSIASYIVEFIKAPNSPSGSDEERKWDVILNLFK